MRKLIIPLLIIFVCMTGCGKNAPNVMTATTYEVETPPADETKNAVAENTVCKVTFYDYDSSVLSVQDVPYGQCVSAPVPGEWSGKTFVGWDKNLEQVNGDMSVHPLYIPTTEGALCVGCTAVAPGKTAVVPVVIANNPGVAGAKITIIYDPALTLTDGQNGSAFAALDFTGPGRLSNPCSFTWDSEAGEATENGAILYLHFEIPADAVLGQSFEVKCAYQEGDIYDEELQNVSLHVFSGVVTVE